MIRTGLIATALAVAAMAGAVAWVANMIAPGTYVPIHWNGEFFIKGADTREQALIVMSVFPLAALLLSGLFSLLPALEPWRENLFSSRKLLLGTWIGVMILLTGICFGFGLAFMRSVENYMNDPFPIIRAIIAASAALFVVIGNYLPKSRRNWFVGIRTPWTMSSDDTWEKTHRLTGLLLSGAGLVGIVLAFVLNGLALALMLPALILPVILFGAVYSYFVWRKANDHDLDPELIV